MRPEHLKSPFTWEKRHIVLHDRVFYVPGQFDAYETFSFPGWNAPEVFAQSQPVKIEFCSGNGAWIADRAQRFPETNWVAVEIRFDRIRKIWSKIKNFNLSNLLAVCGEAFIVTRQYFPTESVAEVFINFPDPWPKTRHAKYRLIQPAFLDQLQRILVPSGKVTVVTDDPVYSRQVIREFQRHPAFVCSDEAPYFRTDLPDYGTSYFEDLWRERGKTIFYHRFQKGSPLIQLSLQTQNRQNLSFERDLINTSNQLIV